MNNLLKNNISFIIILSFLIFLDKNLYSQSKIHLSNYISLLETAVIEAPDEVYYYIANYSDKLNNINNIYRSIYVIDLSVRDSIVIDCKVTTYIYNKDSTALECPVFKDSVMANILHNKKINFQFLALSVDEVNFRIDGNRLFNMIECSPQ